MCRKNFKSENVGLVQFRKKLFLTIEIGFWVCQAMLFLNPPNIAFSCGVAIFTCRVMLQVV